jgi:hypothetical protein
MKFEQLLVLYLKNMINKKIGKFLKFLFVEIGVQIAKITHKREIITVFLVQLICSYLYKL